MLGESVYLGTLRLAAAEHRSGTEAVVTIGGAG